MAYEIRTTAVFDRWAAQIKDKQAARAIAQRLARLAAEHLGDVKNVGESVLEMRVFVGQGYRLYFTRRGETLIVLLCGGDKSSQARDIQTALALAKTL